MSGCCVKRVTRKNELPPWRFRACLLCLAVFQNGLIGGITFGWASINRTMLKASEEEGGADLSLHDSTLIFSYASSVSMVSSLVLGILLDAFGPRICSITSATIVASGCFLFASSDSFVGYALSTCLIAFGGPGITSSIIHISNLVPAHENTVMSCLTGSITLSFSVYAVFDMLWEYFETISFRDLFLNYIWIVVISAVLSFWLYPDESYIQVDDDFLEQIMEPRADLLPTINEDEENLILSRGFLQKLSSLGSQSSHGRLQHQENPFAQQHLIEQPLESWIRDSSKMIHKSSSFLMSQKAIKQGHPEMTSLKDQPFYNQVFSGAYLRAILVFVVTSFCTNFYVASITTEVS
jgi:MFS family permease